MAILMTKKLYTFIYMITMPFQYIIYNLTILNSEKNVFSFFVNKTKRFLFPFQ